MEERSNKLQKFVLEFQNGTQIICAKRTGFSTLLEGIRTFRDADLELESMRLAYVRDIMERRKEQEQQK